MLSATKYNGIAASIGSSTEPFVKKDGNVVYAFSSFRVYSNQQSARQRLDREAEIVVGFEFVRTTTMPLPDFPKPNRQPLDKLDVRPDATIPAGFERRFLADEMDLEDLTIALQHLLDDPLHVQTKRRKTDLPSGSARVTHVLEGL